MVDRSMYHKFCLDFLAYHMSLHDKFRKLAMDPFVLHWLGNYLGNILQQVEVGGQTSVPEKGCDRCFPFISLAANIIPNQRSR